VRAAKNRFWQLKKHTIAPHHVRDIVTTMLLIRLIEHEPASILHLMPNELMFEIFSFLPTRCHILPATATTPLALSGMYRR
jgi:hypothetical protein